MAQSRSESTWDIYNYGQKINQFPSNTIKARREYELIQKKIRRQKMSIIFNEICIYIWLEFNGKNIFKPQKNYGYVKSNITIYLK